MKILFDIGYYALRLWMRLTIRQLEKNPNVSDITLSVTINSHDDTRLENTKTELSVRTMNEGE